MSILGVVNVKEGKSNRGRYEVKKSFGWIVEFPNIDSILGYENANISLRSQCHKASRPSLGVGEIELKWGTESWYVATKAPNGGAGELSLSFYDAAPPIPTDTADDGVDSVESSKQITGPHDDSGSNLITASTILYRWHSLIYNRATGRLNVAPAYKTSILVHLVAPDNTATDVDNATNDIYESWLYFGCFPKDIRLGDLDYAADGALNVDATFRYDKVYRVKTTEKNGAFNVGNHALKDLND